MKIKMKRKARTAEGIQYLGVQSEELDTMLTSIGYTNINIFSDCLMARGGSNNKELLCLYVGDWMIQGENGTIWRETKKAIESKYDLIEIEEENESEETNFDCIESVREGTDWSEHILKIERGLSSIKWELAERKFDKALRVLSKASVEMKRMRSSIIAMAKEERK